MNMTTHSPDSEPQEPTGMTPELPGPDWVRDAVFYQIFPERFENGDPSTDPVDVQPWGGTPTRDNFFGGDLPGITKRLGHLEQLGITSVYLTPIFEAATNHRYDATDYTKVDPTLGGDKAFETFLDHAHDAGIKVVLDAVFHHCGIQHPFFQDVIANQAESAYVNWFSVSGFPVESDPTPNYLTCSGCWYLPKLNVYNPAVREHLFDVTRQWVRAGIDGWRLDVPYMLENPNFWQQFRRVVKDHDPDLYICAEVWEQATEWTTGTTSDAAMNYRLRDAILQFVNEWRGGGEAFARELAAIDQEIRPEARGLMMNLLGSHDTERLLTHCGGDVEAVKLAYGLLFGAQGAPMIYYGDEIGMSGFNDPDCRKCMEWDESQWDHGLLDWVKRLIRLRRDNVALRRGREETVQFDENVIVRRRAHSDQEILVLANRGGSAITVPISGQEESTGLDLITGKRVTLAAVQVPARGVTFVETH